MNQSQRTTGQEVATRVEEYIRLCRLILKALTSGHQPRKVRSGTLVEVYQGRKSDHWVTANSATLISGMQSVAKPSSALCTIAPANVAQPRGRHGDSTYTCPSMDLTSTLKAPSVQRQPRLYQTPWRTFLLHAPKPPLDTNHYMMRTVLEASNLLLNRLS